MITIRSIVEAFDCLDSDEDFSNFFIILFDETHSNLENEFFIYRYCPIYEYFHMSFTKGGVMVDRTNTALVDVVNKGLGLFRDGKLYQGVILMKSQGVPDDVITRVLYEPKRMRSNKLRKKNL